VSEAACRQLKAELVDVLEGHALPFGQAHASRFGSRSSEKTRSGHGLDINLCEKLFRRRRVHDNRRTAHRPSRDPVASAATGGFLISHYYYYLWLFVFNVL
jgi:hypothetical protein